MYTRMCSLIAPVYLFEQTSIVNIVNKQFKARVGKVVEKKLDETIGKCMNGQGCQYKDGCVLMMNKDIKTLIRNELKKTWF